MCERKRLGVKIVRQETLESVEVPAVGTDGSIHVQKVVALAPEKQVDIKRGRTRNGRRAARRSKTAALLEELVTLRYEWMLCQ